MKRGGTILCSVATLAIAACTGASGKLQLRPMPTALAAGERPASFRVAEARGQFALGNVALALEGFRRALREDPGSVDAMTGIAACYDMMTRFDLSRRHYEAALAIAPGDPRLLAAFASSLDQQGRRIEAATVRTEIGQRLAAMRAPAPQPSVPAAAFKPAPVIAAAPPVIAAAPPVARKPAATIAPPALTPLVKSAAARPLPVIAPLAPAQPAPRVAAKPAERQDKAPIPAAAPPVQTTEPTPSRVAMLAAPAAAGTPAPVASPAPAASPAPLPRVAVSAIGPSVTVALPPARPAAPAPAPLARPAATTPPAPPPAPAVPPVERLAEKAAKARSSSEERSAAPRSGPRLERTSLNEVALVTTPAPIWRALAVNRTPRSATIRYVPIRQAASRFAGIRLLNAARVDRLAARTRAFLVGRGWRPMTIGNAGAVRDRSIIFYPIGRRATAQTLSRQFGFAIAQRSGARHITVLLGRDAAQVSALRAKG